MNTITPSATIISAILIVVVLIAAFNLRGKIKRNERGNEFFPWEREAHSADKLFETGEDENKNEDEDEDMEEDEDEDE